MSEQTFLLREALGASLHQARTEQRLTLREISTQVYVSLGYFSEVERGNKEASSKLLASICETFQIELANLLIAAVISLRNHNPATVSMVILPATEYMTPLSERLAAAWHFMPQKKE